MSKVLIIDCGDYSAVDDKIARVFGEFPRDWKGKKVLVKPNILNNRPPEQGNTTHPSIVSAVVGWLLSAGAMVTVGDNSSSLGGPKGNERCAQGTGIASASMGCYRNISLEPIDVTTRSRFTRQFTVSKAVMDADILISLPKFKTHSLTQITGAIKNSFGILVGGEKQRVHGITGSYRNFSEAVVDVYQVRPPELVIMDAIVGMEGNGPSSGDLRRVGKIIASEDGVAVDAVMTTMMGKKPTNIHLLKVAKQRGIGEINISEMEIIGDLNVIEDFRMPSTFYCHVAGRLLNNRLTRSFVQYKPTIPADKCRGCGVCAEICPVGAISMDSKVAVIDSKICICCYCCHELCPHSVVELRRMLKF